MCDGITPGGGNVIHLLRDAHVALVQELVNRLRADGYEDVRPAHARVFDALDPAGSRLTQLAERAQLTHQAMGELVAQLEAGGYLERGPDPRDGRARVIVLTDRGRRHLRDAQRHLQDLEAECTRRLCGTGLDVTGLRTALERLVVAP
jgi:DNA-binding MarR family transcriptional regulator